MCQLPEKEAAAYEESLACDRLSGRRVEGLRPPNGTVLVREWQGTRHRVTVLDDGVVYRGRHYQSLSEVTRAITGTG